MTRTLMFHINMLQLYILSNVVEWSWITQNRSSLIFYMNYKSTKLFMNYLIKLLHMFCTVCHCMWQYFRYQCCEREIAFMHLWYWKFNLMQNMFIQWSHHLLALIYFRNFINRNLFVVKSFNFCKPQFWPNIIIMIINIMYCVSVKQVFN